MKIHTKYPLVLLSSLLLSDASAAVVIQNDFNGLTLDSGDVGPAIQQLTNSIGGSGRFDPATSTFTNSTNDVNASGFNSSSLEALDPLTTQITATFDIASVADPGALQFNGFFLGIITGGTGATNTDGIGLFNNAPLSFGLQIFNEATSESTSLGVVRDGANGVTNNLVNNNGLSEASVGDGFTFTLVLRNDGTYDASTIGLLDVDGNSFDLNLTNQALADTSKEDRFPDFNDFLTDGVGINGSIVGPSVGFTINSATVEVEVVPEPSSTALVGLGGLALLTRRKRA